PRTHAPLFSTLFFSYDYGAHRDLHSFPTRRSSDLGGSGRRCRMLAGQLTKLGDVPIKIKTEALLLPKTQPRLPSGRLTGREGDLDRKSTRLNSSHVSISYAVFCLKKKNISND